MSTNVKTAEAKAAIAAAKLSTSAAKPNVADVGKALSVFRAVVHRDGKQLSRALSIVHAIWYELEASGSSGKPHTRDELYAAVQSLGFTRPGNKFNTQLRVEAGLTGRKPRFLPNSKTGRIELVAGARYPRARTANPDGTQRDYTAADAAAAKAAAAKAAAK